MEIGLVLTERVFDIINAVNVESGCWSEREKFSKPTIGVKQ